MERRWFILVREDTGISYTCHIYAELLKFEVLPGSESKGVLIRTSPVVSSIVWVLYE
jgi:hypothetical protein